MKLCYVEDNWAYFTDKEIVGKDKQWGDDWNDAPYEHNAGEPYEHNGEKIVKIAWDGEFERPGEIMCNSPYTVERINQGVVAWLVTDRWFEGEAVAIPAGVSPEEFRELIERGGGKVYLTI